jgi:hypothetical protein
MSVATTTEFCNLALGGIGANRLLDFAGDSTIQAVQCRLHYSNIRDAVIRSYDWNFAKVTLKLASTWATATTYTTDQYVWVGYRGQTIATATVGIAGAGIFTITSTTDISIDYPVGKTFYVQGSTANDGTYTVKTATYVGTTLTIVPAEAVVSGVDDGKLIIVSATQYLYKCAVAHTSSTYFYTDLGALTPKWTLYATRPTGSGYSYQYVLPTDYLRLVYNRPHHSRWEVERGMVLTCATEVTIRYIKQITDVTQMTDPLFLELFLVRFKLRLMAALALQLSGAAREQLQVELRDAESRARNVNTAENNEVIDYPWEISRRSGADFNTGYRW